MEYKTSSFLHLPFKILKYLWFVFMKLLHFIKNCKIFLNLWGAKDAMFLCFSLRLFTDFCFAYQRTKFEPHQALFKLFNLAVICC